MPEIVVAARDEAYEGELIGVQAEPLGCRGHSRRTGAQQRRGSGRSVHGVRDESPDEEPHVGLGVGLPGEGHGAPYGAQVGSDIEEHPAEYRFDLDGIGSVAVSVRD